MIRVNVNSAETSLSVCNDQAGNGLTEASRSQRRLENETEIPNDVDNVQGISYSQALAHLFKANIGSGIFAMGDAMKNGGIVLGPILTVVIGIVCVHCQHLLLRCSRKIRKDNNIDSYPDYARTVELCFENGPLKLKPWSKAMRITANTFLCVSQLGFCCIIIVFVDSNLRQVWSQYGIVMSNSLHLLIVCAPYLLVSLVTNLKYMAPFSYLGNTLMLISFIIIYYFLCDDLPSPSERNFVGSWSSLPLFFGTVLYSFEGIGLVLPLQNAMRVHRDYYRPIGVLNIGMLIVTCLDMGTGFLGYLKYGEAVEGSLSLNVPQDNSFAKSMRILLCICAPFAYILQLFVATQILWQDVKEKINFCSPTIGESIFRVSVVLITIVLAISIPKLSLLISLIGGVTSPVLALIFPAFIDLVVRWQGHKGPGIGLILKNITIMLLAMLGLFTCAYESILQITLAFYEDVL